MITEPTSRADLLALIARIDDADVEEVLGYTRWLLADEDEPTPEELAAAEEGQKQIERGEYHTFAELRARLKPSGERKKEE